MKVLDFGLKQQTCGKCNTKVELEPGDLISHTYNFRKGQRTVAYWECPMCHKKNYI